MVERLRMRRILSLALVGLTLGVVGAADTARAEGAAADPTLEWRTIESAHFLIHYHEPLAIVARRVAVVAERAQARIGAALGHVPDTQTDIVITDDTDYANGSATAYPHNVIRLYATAPEDLSPLADYDDWLTDLVFHEDTHILHMDQISGVAAVVNAIFGRVYIPNTIAPRWFLEGLAVFEETDTTAGGRLRSSIWDMFLRMDALEGRLLRLDQVSNEADRWPHGDAWYLYGSQFMRSIADHHGRTALSRMTHEYGGQAVPYALSRVARHTTGMTLPELWNEFLEDTRARARDQAARVEREGRLEGTRLTFHGEEARTPRFLPDGRAMYFENDSRGLEGYRYVDPRDGGHGAGQDIVHTWGLASAAPHPDGERFVYSSLGWDRELYAFNDLWEHDLRTGHDRRLTVGARAAEPDVAPDGRRIVFTVSSAGTSSLAIADLADVPGTQHMLFTSERFGQVYAPRWSPDGRTVAFSAWLEGGKRDIVLVDVASGALSKVTDDRASDAGPCWSPDGRTLYFSSDRTGITNLYAWERETGALSQITNVIAGAFMPTVSPDGRRILYIGYSSFGWDVWGIDVDRTRWRPAPPYVDRRPAAAEPREIADLPSRPYDPLPTLRPYNYLLDFRPDGFGPQLGINVGGEDVVGFHSWTARVGVSLVKGYVNVDATYRYHHTPADLGLHVFHTVDLAGGLYLGGQARTWVAETLGADLGVGYSFRRPFDSDTFSLGYTIGTSWKAEDYVANFDPNDPPPVLPTTGRFASLRVGWSFNGVRRFPYDIGAAEGVAFSVSVGAQHPLLGSQFPAISAQWAIQTYLRMPWEIRHVLALRYAGGLAGGQPGHRDFFYVGGFPETNLIDQLTQLSLLGGVALRGYPAYFHGGTQFHLAQVEYRFPIWRINAGVETIPFYLNRLYGNAFSDVGNAFNGTFDPAKLLVGVGGELLLDFTIGYVIGYTLRFGIARGLMEGGDTHVYCNLGGLF